jgi:hypothetical protein
MLLIAFQIWSFLHKEVNGQEYKNIYGLTLSAKREGGTRTELWIKRVVNPYLYGFTTSSFAKQNSSNSSQPPSRGEPSPLYGSVEYSMAADLPSVIEDLTITAQLLKDKYEYRYFGMFRITLKRLVLISDETAVDCADGVIGPLRYYVSGSVTVEVFTSTGETIA